MPLVGTALFDTEYKLKRTEEYKTIVYRRPEELVSKVKLDDKLPRESVTTPGDEGRATLSG